MRPLNRVKPKGPTNAYTTFAVRAPLETHFRRASCAEFGCTAYLEGWAMDKAALVDSGLLSVVKDSGRRYREMDMGDSVVLVFEPGQVCFRASEHMLPNGRIENFYVGPGDHRSFRIRDARQHRNPLDFVDEMANNFDKIRSLQERG